MASHVQAAKVHVRSSASNSRTHRATPALAALCAHTRAMKQPQPTRHTPALRAPARPLTAVSATRAHVSFIPGCWCLVRGGAGAWRRWRMFGTRFIDPLHFRRTVDGILGLTERSGKLGTCIGWNLSVLSVRTSAAQRVTVQYTAVTLRSPLQHAQHTTVRPTEPPRGARGRCDPG